MRKRKLVSKEEMKKPISAARLKHWRNERAWTQEDAADWLGVSLKAYQNWEQGARTMRHPVAINKLMEQAPNKRRA